MKTVKNMLGILACIMMFNIATYAAKPHHPKLKNKNVKGSEHIRKHHSPNAKSEWGYNNI